MIKRIRSLLRGTLNKARKKLIKNKKTQKILVVKLNNFRCLLHGNKRPIQTTFDYKKIMNGPHIFPWKEEYHGNVLYGVANALREYAGISKPLNCCIEHGVYFGDYVNLDEAVDSGFPKLLTFGKQRIQHIAKISNIEAIPIGPYIYYAEPSLADEDIKDIKRKNGKTLLVFPSHSIDRIDMEFDIDAFIDKIERFKTDHNFNKVIVCLFYKDILLKRDVAYLSRGFQVVTNGYREDPMFLRRLKSFILISDYTISNNVGTHIGYCVSLGKPHQIFEQTIRLKAYTKNDLKSEMSIGSPAAEKEEGIVKEAFTQYSKDITPKQREVVSWFWGTDCIKTKDEMRNILTR